MLKLCGFGVSNYYNKVKIVLLAKGLPFEEAMRRLNVASGTQYDPSVVNCFTEIAQPDMEQVFAATGTRSSVVI